MRNLPFSSKSPLTKLILPFYVPTFLLAFCQGMLVPTLPLYAASFEISYSLIGLALASQGIGNLAGDVPAGVLIGYIGEKRTMAVGITMLFLSMLILTLSSTLWGLILFMFISGVGYALWNISRHAYIANNVSVGYRGRAIALFGGVNRIGMFAGPVVGGAVAAFYGLRSPFLVYAVISAISLLFPFLFSAHTDLVPTRRQPRHEGHLRQILGLLVDHKNILLPAGIGQFFAQMIRSGRKVIVPLFAADILGLGVQEIGWIVSLSAAIDMSLFPVAGILMDKLGRKYSYVPSFLIQAIGMALVPFATGFFTLLAATMLVGLGNGIGSGTMMTLGADLAPQKSRSEFFGVWRLIGDMGQTGAPVVVGNIADLLGLSPATFVIALSGLAAAMTLGLLVPETLKAEPQRASAAS